MATFSQGIDIQLKLVAVDKIFAEISKIEEKMKQAFGSNVISKSQEDATKVVAQATAKQTELVKQATENQAKATNQLASKMQQSFEKIAAFAQKYSSFDNVKAGVSSLNQKLKENLQVNAQSVQQGNILKDTYIKIGDAAQKYGVSMASLNKWAKRGKVSSKQDLATDLTTPLAQRELLKVQVTNEVIRQGLHESGTKAKVLVALVDNLALHFTALLKPVEVFVSKMKDAAKIKAGEALDKAEKSAKKHESTLRKIYDIYMKIYSAPFKGIASAWNFLTKKQAPAQTETQAPSITGGSEQISKQATASIEKAKTQVKALAEESRKTTSVLDMMKKALWFTVKLPLEPFRMLGNMATSVFNGIKSIGIAAFAAIAGSAMWAKNQIATALAFDREISMVWTLLDKTKDQMRDVAKDVKQIAMETGTNIAESAKGLYWTISAGVNELAGFTDKTRNAVTKSIAEIATATGGDTTSTTRAIMGVVNAFGDQLGKTIEEQVKRASDIMFQTTFLGITSVPELANSLGYINNIAAQTGVSFEEIGAALAVLTRSGLGTDNAVTALKATISEILKPSEQASELAQRLGIDFSIAGLKAKGYAKFMTEVLEKTGGKAEYTTVLFNNIRSLTEVLGKTENNQRFLEFLKEMEKSAGSTEKAMGKLRNSASFKEKQLDVRFEVRQQKLGEMIIPKWQMVKEGFLNVLDSAGLILEEFWTRQAGDTQAADAMKKQYENMFLSMPKALQVASSIIATILNSLTYIVLAVKKQIEVYSASFVKFFEGLKLEFGFDPIMQGVDLVGKAWLGIMEKIAQGGAWVIDIFGKIIIFIASIFKKTEETTAKVSEGSGALSAFRALAESIWNVFVEIVRLIGNLFSILGSIINEVAKLEKRFGVITGILKVVGFLIVAPLLALMKLVEWTLKLLNAWGVITGILKVVGFLIVAPLLALMKLVEWTLKLLNAWLEFESEMRGIVGFIMYFLEGFSTLSWAIIHPLQAIQKSWEFIKDMIWYSWEGLKNLYAKTMDFGAAITNLPMFVGKKIFGKSDEPASKTIAKENTELAAAKQINAESEKAIKIIEQKQKLEEQNIKLKEKLKEVEKTGNQKEMYKVWRQIEENKDVIKELESSKIEEIKTPKEEKKIQEKIKKLEENSKKIIEVVKAETNQIEDIKNKSEEKIIEMQEKSIEKKIEIVKTEAEKIREIQFQKEQDELKYLARLEYYIEKDAKRKTDIIKKEIENQQKIYEKAKEKQFSIDERWGKAMETFEERKTRIISSPLSQEGKDIQQRGLAKLYELKMSQAMGQNNFDEAERLAQKAQDIWAGLAERTDNALRDQDYSAFLKSNEKLMNAYAAEKKANEEVMQTATKRIAGLKQELNGIFIELQKNLSINVNTDQATMKLTALQTKFNELRKDMSVVLGNDPDEVISFSKQNANPILKSVPSLGMQEKQNVKIEDNKENRKIEENTKGTVSVLKEIKEVLDKKQVEEKKQKTYSQNVNGQFVVTETKK